MSRCSADTAHICACCEKLGLFGNRIAIELAIPRRSIRQSEVFRVLFRSVDVSDLEWLIRQCNLRMRESEANEISQPDLQDLDTSTGGLWTKFLRFLLPWQTSVAWTDDPGLTLKKSTYFRSSSQFIKGVAFEGVKTTRRARAPSCTIRSRAQSSECVLPAYYCCSQVIHNRRYGSWLCAAAP